MTKLYINAENSRYETYSNEEYGEWNIDNNIQEKNIIIINSKEKFSEYMEVDFDVKEGDTLYLVKAVYDTGNSFGAETGVVQYIEIFETFDEAKKFKDLVNLFHNLEIKDYYREDEQTKKNRIKNLKFQLKDNLIERKNWNRNYVFKFKNKEYRFKWDGYFENLTNLDLIPLIVK